MQQARQLSTGHDYLPHVQPNRGRVVIPQPGHRLRKFKLLLVLITCFLLSLTVVAQYSSLVIMNYRLSNNRVELAAMKETVRVLELEAAELSSIGRIEAIAREELGMVEPQLNQLRVLTASQGTGNRLGE
jgi:cell division protein FtsL